MKIKLSSLTEKVYKNLLNNEIGLTSQDIVKEFMKIEKVSPLVAEKVVDPVLSKDTRFFKTEDGFWKSKKSVPMEKLPLSEVSFIIFYIHEVEDQKNKKVLYQAGKVSPQGMEYKNSYSSFLLYRGGYVEEIKEIDTVVSNVNNYVFIPYDLNSFKLFRRLYREKFYMPPDILAISIRDLITNMYPQKKLKNWNDLIREFSIINVESSLAISKTKTVLYVFEHLLNKIEEMKIDNIEKLIEFINKDKKKINFSKYSFDKDFLTNIPEYSGVYLFYNKTGEVIYVGKTNNLRRRINSYFWNTGESLEKIKGILDDIFRIEYMIMGSELEAIVEEYNLIKKFKPKYNTQINIPERIVETSKRIVLLPSIESENGIVLFFLCNGLPLIKDEFNCKKSKEIIDKIKLILSSEDYSFDPAKLLVINYIKRYGDNINIIELENYSDENAILNSLLDHCKEIDSLSIEKKRYFQQ